MQDETLVLTEQEKAVNAAFSTQSDHYDADDVSNQVIQDLRQRVYIHVEKFLKPNSSILELNCGTGIDAVYFASNGHHVHAIDISEGMIAKTNAKIIARDIEKSISTERLSFIDLDKFSTQRQFDFVFSNFGGLNCTEDLRAVVKNLPSILNDGAFISFVVMPRVCPWELISVLKGNFGTAFRRFKRQGVSAVIDGQKFKTYYHSLSKIKSSFPATFKFISSVGLAGISPPPHRSDFPSRYPHLYKLLAATDIKVTRLIPFDRCADHIIVTFQYRQQ
jgi:SAM-dependent methyltransferase